MNRTEWRALLNNGQASAWLQQSREALSEIFGPETAAEKDYDQNNPHHVYSLLEHTLRTLEGLELDGLTEEESVELKTAAVFHDVGKPSVAFRKKDGRTVFYNHAAKSCDIARQRLRERGFEGESLKRILFYIEQHDAFISFKTAQELQDDNHPHLRKITADTVQAVVERTQQKCREHGHYVPSLADYRRLMRLCKADAKAQAPLVIRNGETVDSVEQKLARLQEIDRILQELEKEQ